MDLQKFIENFAGQFDETDKGEFKADTKFRSLPEWNSMIALSIIAMIDDEYNIVIKGDDIRNSQTIEEIFNKVKGYKG